MATGSHLSFVALALALALTLTACGKWSGDKVERFAEAEPAGEASIAVPGYETLAFMAGSTRQAVNLQNPASNACAIELSLALDNGEVLWAGEALLPGEAFTSIVLGRALDEGSYAATLHYDCFSLQDGAPLNGANVELTIEAR